MPLDLEKQMNFSPVETGDMTEVPPDLPVGHWTARCVVKPVVGKPEKGSYPGLILEWEATEDLKGGNESFVGASSSDYIGLYPAEDQRAKMQKVKTKQLCDGLNIAPPDTSSLADGTLASLVPFVEELEGSLYQIWTTVETDKEGVSRTRIHYTAPGGGALKPKTKKDDEDEEEAEEEATEEAAEETEEKEPEPTPEPEKPKTKPATKTAAKKAKK